MPQGKPLDPAKRAAILADIDAGKNRNEIARRQEVSASTVSRIAAAHGRSFDRSSVETATRARQADNKARRAALATAALDDADAMRRRALAAEAGRDARDFATAYGIFIDKHAVLERLDSDGGTEQARSMLGALAAGLQAAAQQLDDPPPADAP
ncbi:hypothetical protein Ssi03_25730 [Sphaerisporangium siamense]|uniref:Uncharacterized protein n=1 Tax=Sphaerisporangium siamense TaxID=795645 RepID=A0A7W7D695_9ACTN|nr:hypothetical protein [Sphaerisporangium siamense]MBB4700100.1 hypothetical protein [Sphaerisporangium siamense]GII84583.1 hypothetical protein Ssi03_25730 [Sphaerisporangium siamense]